jgi:hypothetical protein
MKDIRKNIRFIAGYFLAFIVCGAFLYALLVLPKFNDKNLIDLVMDGVHTGLSKPVVRIAFDGENKASEKIAEIENPKRASPQKQEIAEGDSSTVLFDISSQPVFGRNNKIVLILWILIFASFIVFIIGLIRKIVKQTKINKIKKG